MFTWTCKIFRGLVGTSLLIALSGCADDGSFKFPDVELPKFAFADRPPTDNIRVTVGQILISGPDGYCVDRKTSRNGITDAFVVLASCAILGREGAASVTTPVILTVNIDRSKRENLALSKEQFETFIRSDAGLKALSLSGVPENVRVLGVTEAGGMYFVRTQDQDLNNLGLSETGWRAFFNVKGQLVTARLLSSKSAPVVGAEGLEVLRAFVTQIERQNEPAL